MKDFWENRYREPAYAYGLEPNTYLRSFIESNPAGRILLPGEGEGRNAVYAALKGWQVDAFDFSEQAREKALRLAAEKGAQINYFISDFTNLQLNTHEYDAVALIFVHIPPQIRRAVHRQLANHLKINGTLLMEAFSKEQIRNNSGGPRDEAMLYTPEELREDFRYLKIDEIIQLDVELDEGKYHRGTANVIHLLARKTGPTIAVGANA